MPPSEPKASTQDVLRSGSKAEPQADAGVARGEQKAEPANRQDPGPFPYRRTKDGTEERTEGIRSVLLEPVSRRDYDLSYACLLIPRADTHFLTGEVIDFLQTTILQICNFFGWRLDLIQIQPEYLQWVVSAPAATPPSRCIRTIREQTSKGILEKFQDFKDRNPLQDFWAPGYLVLVGPAPHPPEVVDEFRRLTRQQQALSKRSG